MVAKVICAVTVGQDLYARNRGLQEVQKELLQQNEESKRKDSRLERLEKMRDALLEQVACLQAQLIVYRDERNRRAPAQEEQLGEQLQNRAKVCGVTKREGRRAS